MRNAKKTDAAPCPYRMERRQYHFVPLLFLELLPLFFLIALSGTRIQHLADPIEEVSWEHGLQRTVWCSSGRAFVLTSFTHSIPPAGCCFKAQRLKAEPSFLLGLPLSTKLGDEATMTTPPPTCSLPFGVSTTWGCCGAWAAAAGANCEE